MSRQRKPIPPPLRLGPSATEASLDEKYPLPFVLAEGPRMMLNFLALHSAIPDAYRRVIAVWLQEHNKQLSLYLMGTYGEQATIDANHIAESMAEGFLAVIAEEREAADRDLFETLDREVFNDDGTGE